MIVLLNTNLVCHRGDSHSSGIPYLPHSLAYLSSVLEKKSINHTVIDSFGEAPWSSQRYGDYLHLGLSPEELASRIIGHQPTAIVLYGNSVFNSHSLALVASTLRMKGIDCPILVTENTQAVTGYSLLRCKELLTSSGVSHAILGESEGFLAECLPELVSQGRVPDVFAPHIWEPSLPVDRKRGFLVENLDGLPWPNWKQFPLTNYWKIGFAHGPMSSKYLALLTSRGCPYPCGFCSVPVMNNQKWRMRSAKNIVQEIEQFISEFGVREFHLEDLNPTIHEGRIVELAELLLERKLNIRWRIVSGTKMDNLKLETLEVMARSGMDYISFSPESGSPEVLKAIRKPFKHDHALKQVELLSRHKVGMQACFVLGYPGETESDLKKTQAYSKSLVKRGVGEVAFFMVAPMPGTPIEGTVEGNYQNLSDLTFSPTWRKDYHKLHLWRRRLYRDYFLTRMVWHPLSFATSCVKVWTSCYALKMEMFPRRFIFKLKSLLVATSQGVQGSTFPTHLSPQALVETTDK